MRWNDLDRYIYKQSLPPGHKWLDGGEGELRDEHRVSYDNIDILPLWAPDNKRHAAESLIKSYLLILIKLLFYNTLSTSDIRNYIAYFLVCYNVVGLINWSAGARAKITFF